MRMENIIINVGRRLGSGGRDIAARLAGDFGCALYDRELLNLAARESGFCKEVFERNDENRGFLRSLFHMHVRMSATSISTVTNFRRRTCSSFRATRYAVRPPRVPVYL